MLLADRVVVISGVGPGLGRATARACAREGAAVGLLARDAARLEQVAAEIRAGGGRALPVPTDVARPEDCRAAAEAVAGAFGGIDVVVNSAFRMDPGSPVAEADLAAWRKVFDVNVFGAVQLTQACLPALRRRAGGAVVMVASMSARKIRPREGAYAASKAALLSLTRTLALELAPERIRVNAVVPGWMWGPNVEAYVAWQARERGVAQEEVVAGITAAIPLGEIPPQEDVAEVIVFLASDRARSITGQAIDVNGGEWTG